MKFWLLCHGDDGMIITSGDWIYDFKSFPPNLVIQIMLWPPFIRHPASTMIALSSPVMSCYHTWQCYRNTWYITSNTNQKLKPPLATHGTRPQVVSNMEHNPVRHEVHSEFLLFSSGNVSIKDETGSPGQWRYLVKNCHIIDVWVL